MTDITKLKAGDRVRLTQDVTVKEVTHQGLFYAVSEEPNLFGYINLSELTAPNARVELIPPPVDPDLLLAREVCATDRRLVSDRSEDWPDAVRNGGFDDGLNVHIALAAIKATKAGGKA